ncbi:PKD domain-containing protein, partial [Candidatus Bipolaricaulota bacterium]
GEPDYTVSGVNPSVGDVGDVFEYRVEYSSLDALPPKQGYPVVHVAKNGSEIAGSPFAMTPEAGDPSYTSGWIYSVSVPLSSAGGYSYWFGAFDDSGTPARGLAVLPADGPVVGCTAPTLSWTGQPGHTNDGIDPDTGDGSTSFVYAVTYASSDGAEPLTGYPRVNILVDGSPIEGNPFVMQKLDDAAVSVGRTYQCSVSGLPAGSVYEYFFEAVDANGLPATGGPAAIVAGPALFGTSVTEFADSSGASVENYCVGETIYVKVRDPSQSGATAIASVVEIGGVTYDLFALAGAASDTFLTQGISLGLAPGDTITATYTDPTDPTDVSSKTIAVIDCGTPDWGMHIGQVLVSIDPTGDRYTAELGVTSTPNNLVSTCTWTLPGGVTKTGNPITHTFSDLDGFQIVSVAVSPSECQETHKDMAISGLQALLGLIEKIWYYEWPVGDLTAVSNQLSWAGNSVEKVYKASTELLVKLTTELDWYGILAMAASQSGVVTQSFSGLGESALSEEMLFGVPYIEFLFVLLEQAIAPGAGRSGLEGSLALDELPDLFKPFRDSIVAYVSSHDVTGLVESEWADVLSLLSWFDVEGFQLRLARDGIDRGSRLSPMADGEIRTVTFREIWNEAIDLTEFLDGVLANLSSVTADSSLEFRVAEGYRDPDTGDWVYSQDSYVSIDNNDIAGILGGVSIANSLLQHLTAYTPGTLFLDWLSIQYSADGILDIFGEETVETILRARFDAAKGNGVIDLNGSGDGDPELGPEFLPADALTLERPLYVAASKNSLLQGLAWLRQAVAAMPSSPGPHDPPIPFPIVIDFNLPPDACFSVSGGTEHYAVPPGQYTVQFDASCSSDLNGDSIVTYEWDFGDGPAERTSTPTVSHPYSFSGGVATYSVSLKVTDQFGRESSRKYETLQLTEGGSPASATDRVSKPHAVDLGDDHKLTILKQDILDAIDSAVDSLASTRLVELDVDGDGTIDFTTRIYAGAWYDNPPTDLKSFLPDLVQTDDPNDPLRIHLWAEEDQAGRYWRVDGQYDAEMEYVALAFPDISFGGLFPAPDLDDVNDVLCLAEFEHTNPDGVIGWQLEGSDP